MPIKMPECAGKLYLPSNGTEGTMFMERWCDYCIHNDESKEVFCEILTKSFIGYVTAWVFDDEGIPKCINFSKE